MRLLKYIKNFHKQQNVFLENNKKEINERNWNVAIMILVLSIVVYCFFIFISIIISSYKNLFFAYLFELITSLIFILILILLKNRIQTIYIIYIAYATLIGYTIFTSALITPNYVSVMILLFLFQLPIVSIDKSMRINVFVILATAIYLIIVIPYKASSIVTDEILNCLLFASMGITIGEFLRYSILENYELKRLSAVQAKVDYLTSLENRRCLVDYLELINREKEKYSNISIILIDIDNFKLYNDQYGHLLGDDCLKKVCAGFKNFSKIHNVKFYRYGGEEFVGVITNSKKENLATICYHLNKFICQLSIPHILNNPNVITISIGAIYLDNNLDFDYDTLLYKADMAMYQAKKNGKNTYYIFK